MEKTYYSLQEAIDHPGIEAVVWASCDKKNLQVEMINYESFTLEIDGMLITPFPDDPDFPYLFHEVEHIERAIQERVPNYELGARLWADQWIS